VHSGQVAGIFFLSFENDLFDPGIGYYTPKISLEKCISRLLSTQWSIFTIHSGPLGGNSQKWASTVVSWAETAKNGHFFCFCTKSGMFFRHHILLPMQLGLGVLAGRRWVGVGVMVCGWGYWLDVG
jgi:hypothetical protein